MSTFAQRVIDLATRVATECKAIRTLVNGNAVDLSALTTTNKANLVLAVNELKAALTSEATSRAAIINDAQPAAVNSTLSASAIAALVTQAVNNLVNGAPGAFDTLKEIADYIASDQTAGAGYVTALANRVRVDAVQAFTAPQQAQARSNIGAQEAALIGDPDTNYVTVFNTGLV